MANGEVSPPLSLLTNGMNGPESFTVIDASPEIVSDRDIQLNGAFVFGNLGQLPVDDLLEKVRDLVSEKDKLKEFMEENNRKMKESSEKVAHKMKLMEEQRTKLKTENAHLRLEMDEEKNRSKNLEDQLNKVQEQLTQTKETCKQLSMENAIIDEVKEERYTYKEENDKLKIELTKVRASLEGLLDDMAESQRLKSALETELEEARLECCGLNAELAKVKRISEKIAVEKQEVVQMNMEMSTMMQNMRSRLETLGEMPSSLQSFDLCRLTESSELARDLTPIREQVSDTGDDVETRADQQAEIVGERNTDIEAQQIESQGVDEVLQDEIREDSEMQDSTINGEYENNEGTLSPPELSMCGQQLMQDSAELIAPSGDLLCVPIACKDNINSHESTGEDDAKKSVAQNKVVDTDSGQSAQPNQDSSQSEHLIHSVHSDQTDSGQSEERADSFRSIASCRDEMDKLLDDDSLMTTETRNEMKRKIYRLIEEVSEKEDRYHELKEDMRKLTEEFHIERQKMAEKITEFEQQQKSDQATMTNQESSLIDLQMEVDRLKAEESKYEREISEHQTVASAEVTSERDRLKEQNEKLKLEVADMKAKCEKEIEENSVLESMVHELREEVGSLTEQLNDMEDQLDGVTEHRDKIQRELSDHRNQTDVMCQDYHQRAHSSEQLQHQVAQKEVECEEYKADIRNLHTQHERLQAELNAVSEELEMYRAQSDVYKNDFHDERTSRQELTTENENLKHQVYILQQRLIPLERRHSSTSPPGHPTTTRGSETNLVSGSGEPHHEIGENECPMCFEHFPNSETLQRHVHQCVT